MTEQYHLEPKLVEETRVVSLITSESAFAYARAALDEGAHTVKINRVRIAAGREQKVWHNVTVERRG